MSSIGLQNYTGVIKETQLELRHYMQLSLQRWRRSGVILGEQKNMK